MCGYEYEYQPRVQLSLSNYPMTNQRPCRAFSNNNVPLRCFSLFVVEPRPPPALPICYRRITQRPHRAQILSRDFYPFADFLWNEMKHTLNSRITCFNIVYLFCLDLFLHSSLFVSSKLTLTCQKADFLIHTFLPISRFSKSTQWIKR